uniref:Uncharacterized protein n=1 Tax=Kalanchoe fedtschenkoi TaxID=63787 RepID=A0A7N0TNG5_KALFE
MDASKSNDVASGDIDVNNQQESNTSGILDLTMEGDIMDMDQIPETEDRKPSQTDLLNPMGSNAKIQTEFDTSNQTNQSSASQMDDDFWSGLELPGYNFGPSSDSFDNQFPANSFNASERAPALTIAMSNQFVRLPAAPANVTRIPSVMQALPATSGIPSSRLTSGATPASMSSGFISSQLLPPVTLNGDGSATASSEAERLREYSRSVMNRLQLPEITSYPSTGLSWDAMQPMVRNSTMPPNSASASANQSSNVQRMHSGHLAGHQQQQRLHQPPQQRPQFLHHPIHPPGMVQTPPHLSRSLYPQPSADTGAINSHVSGSHTMPSRRPFQPLRQPHPSPYQNQAMRQGQSYHGTVGSPGMSIQQPRAQVQQVSLTENLVNLSAVPTARMRGSLSGRALEDARNQFLSPPTQSSRAHRPLPSNQTCPPPGIPLELHELVTNLSVPDSSTLS